jgi:MFS family permease
MVGMERSILPLLAEQEFQLAARTAILSFIVVFGVTKALTNYAAGRFADRIGRRQILIAGWLVAAPVPFMLMWAPTWTWVLIANGLLGISQGFTWSTTVIMKIDLVGRERRGLAMGLNEFAGYIAVAGAALATGWVAAHQGLRPEPFYLGVLFVIFGLGLSLLLVRETQSHVTLESRLHSGASDVPTSAAIFWRTTIGDRNLSSISQAGLVNNLNDGMAWGLFPLFFAGRKWLIATGMWTQAGGIAVIALSEAFFGFAMGSALLGVGTAMVYPTLLAGIGDVAVPSWRASAIGVYRFWRDLGYAIGALIAGVTADLLGLAGAFWIVAGLTFISGLIVAFRMRETLSAASVGQRKGITHEPRA